MCAFLVCAEEHAEQWEHRVHKYTEQLQCSCDLWPRLCVACSGSVYKPNQVHEKNIYSRGEEEGGGVLTLFKIADIFCQKKFVVRWLAVEPKTNKIYDKYKEKWL